ncbi:MAG: hypothetical protein HYZ27_08595 [Deltaproteobacteria bacterium]|nr:hypothetical protein [Deltaproteobacteria bacterium]
MKPTSKGALGLVLVAGLGTLLAQASPLLGLLTSSGLAGAVFPWLSGETRRRVLLAATASSLAAVVVWLYLGLVVGAGHAVVRDFANGPWLPPAVVPLLGLFSLADLRASGRGFGGERVQPWRR